MIVYNNNTLDQLEQLAELVDFTTTEDTSSGPLSMFVGGVEVIRADRPDILCPTFLDIPGQHGHHRAMTQAAHEAMAAAADPAFEAAGEPWQVSKLYLPAWSGAGDAYDDDLPPPPATVHIPGTGHEPLSGWTWAEIGQQSRVFHATQGMGRWTGGTEPSAWPLHLVRSTVGPDQAGAKAAITSAGNQNNRIDPPSTSGVSLKCPYRLRRQNVTFVFSQSLLGDGPVKYW